MDITRGATLPLKAFGLATLAGLGLVAASQPAAAQYSSIQRVSLTTSDILYDSLTQQIYASVPSSVGLGGNSITAINPATAAVGASVFIGSEPGKLALSSDGTSLYAALTGASAIRLFNVPTGTAGLQFSIGSGLTTEDMAVVPGQPQELAVVRENTAESPHFVSTTIYSNGTALPNATIGQDSIAFNSSGSVLYSYNNSTTQFDFDRLNVGSNGFAPGGDQNEGLITGGGLSIKAANGLVFANNGVVIDPSVPTDVGTFSGTGYGVPFAVQPGDTSAYFLEGTGSTRTLVAYDTTTFIPTGSLSIGGISGNVNSLIRFGSDGLAFNTSGGQVFLIHTSLVAPEPSQYAGLGLGALGLGGLVFKARRRRAPAGA